MTVTVETLEKLERRITLTVPAVHDEVGVLHEMETRSQTLDPTRAPILVLEDDLQTLAANITAAARKTCSSPSAMR